MVLNPENDDLLKEEGLENSTPLVNETPESKEETPLELPTSVQLEEEGAVAHVVLTDESPELPREQSPKTEEITSSEPEPEVEIGTSENAVLSEIRNMIAQGKATEYVPRAEVNELILFTSQLSQQFSAETFQTSVDLAKVIKTTFDDRVKADAISNDDQQRFSLAFGNFNKRKNDFLKKSEEQNTSRKLELIQVLKDKMESKSLTHNDVKEIQTEWKTLRFVARDKKAEIDNSYRSLLDKYYSQKGQEMELLDYDRKKNLNTKKEIIEKIRGLLPSEEDAGKDEVWKEKASILNDLQRQWRESGQIRKEELEAINSEYNEVVESFFAQRREFFESKEQGRQENADKKEELLAQMQSYSTFQADKPKDWEEAAKKLLELQESWKAIGKAPAEVNTDLWKRFREVGTAFFGAKNQFYKQLDEVRAQNIEVKTALVERAEAMKDSEAWEATRAEYQKLSEQWKASGPVPERVGNKLWTRFREACDAFFSRLREHSQSVRGEEEENLEKKRRIINRVLEVTENMEDREVIYAEVLEMQKEWKTIGRVPVKFKNSIREEYETAIEAFFQQFRSTKRSTPNTGGGFNKDRGNNNKGGGKSHAPSYREREEAKELEGVAPATAAKIQKLKKQIQKSQEMVDQYGTNILYIAKGKSGDVLRAEIQSKIDAEMDIITKSKKELKEINASIAKARREQEEAANVVVADENPATEEVVSTEVTEIVADATETPAEETNADENSTESSDEAEA